MNLTARTRRLGKSWGLFVWNMDVLLSPLFSTWMDEIHKIILIVFPGVGDNLTLILELWRVLLGGLFLKVTSWETTVICQTTTAETPAYLLLGRIVLIKIQH